jgi:hypothetical protein
MMVNSRRCALAAIAAAGLMVPAVQSMAALSSYSQDFESLSQATPSALSGSGWNTYVNLFSPDHSSYYYGYGFPSGNNDGHGSGIDVGQGGVTQGAQQLVVYSDYGNGGAHGAGQQVETNVYQERTIGAADLGTTWIFSFDAKLGNLATPSSSLAFIKTLDPNNGYATTNFLFTDTTAIPAAWGTYSAPSLTITPALVGQIFQFGFANTASNFVASGVYYDNINLVPTPASMALLAVGGPMLLRRRR